MQHETVDRDPLDLLAEQFLERHRYGDGPTIEQFAQQHAPYADEIRELFPTIIGMEQLKQQQEQALSLAAEAGVTSDQIGDFHIVREIGRGGMGVVYEAVQQSLKRHVALKVLGRNVSASARHLRRFRREAEAAARLHHTNIVPIYGTGHVDGVHFYAMQLIRGVGLDEVIQALQLERATTSPLETPSNTRDATCVDGSSPHPTALRAARRLRSGAYSRDQRSESSDSEGSHELDAAVPVDGDQRHVVAAEQTTGGQMDSGYWRSVARITRDVAQAMDYAHRHGVLHRDIKPANLLLDHEGIVWVADFGLARHEEGEAVTKTGDFVGTLRYMAPEQFHDQATGRSDVYSLGLTLYELLTLQPAFGDARHGPLVNSKANGAFPPPSSINSRIPADLETITLKASATNVAHRYRSAGEMAEDLDRFLDERPILARRIGVGERLWRWSRRNPAVACLGSLAMLLLVMIAAILGWANYRTTLALRSAELQRQRAVNAAGEARREESRAEGNLQLALGAFEGIMRNLATRGVPDSLEVDLGDGEVYYDVVVTTADAALLQTLLSFYDQFARQNQLDLQLETATAHVRIGDIYQRLGNLEAAAGAYRAALHVYDGLLNSAADSDELILAKAVCLNELAVSLGRGGDLDSATRLHGEAERLLRDQPALIEKPAGRFELARTLNLLASRPFRAGHDRVIGTLTRSQRPTETRWRGRGPGAFGGRPAVIYPGPGPAGLVSMAESSEARQLLEQLVRDYPQNAEYRLALAQTFQTELRLQQLPRRSAGGEVALEHAVRFLEQAMRDFPGVPAFQYALADTLSLVMPGDRRQEDAGLQQIERAILIATRLAETCPHVPEYQSLQGRLESDLAAAHAQSGRLAQAENSYLAAIRQQESLVNRYESVSLYRLLYAQSLYELAQVQRRLQHYDAARSSLQTAAVQVERFAQLDQPSRRLYGHFLCLVYQRLATTCRDLGDDQQADGYMQQAEAIAAVDRVPRMGRFRFRPGDLHRRSWGGFGG